MSNKTPCRAVLNLMVLVAAIGSLQAITLCEWGTTPVCGEDFVTYPNLCALAESGVPLKSQGACTQIIDATGKIVSNCPKTYAPVCADNAVTYINDCYAKAFNYTVAYTGVCFAKGAIAPTYIQPAVTDCNVENKPVCDKNGVNWAAECPLKELQELPVSEGACASPCNCSTDYDPVCGVNGKTIDNKCLADCLRVTVIGKGECENIVLSCDNCSKVLVPVCSKDNVDYANSCQLFCNKKSFGRVGACDRSAELEEANRKKECAKCSKLYKPVCTTDGETLANECLCSCQGANKCQIYAEGSCPDFSNKVPTIFSCEAKCSGNKAECGVDQKTYKNECTRKCMGINLFSRGPCVYQGNYSSVLPVDPLSIPDIKRYKKEHKSAKSAKSAKAPVKFVPIVKQQDKKAHHHDDDEDDQFEDIDFDGIFNWFKAAKA